MSHVFDNLKNPFSDPWFDKKHKIEFGRQVEIGGNYFVTFVKLWQIVAIQCSKKSEITRIMNFKLGTLSNTVILSCSHGMTVMLQSSPNSTKPDPKLAKN